MPSDYRKLMKTYCLRTKNKYFTFFYKYFDTNIGNSQYLFTY